MTKSNNRRSLVVRLQPSNGTPLAEVIDWLKSMSSQDRNEKIAEVLIMSCLAYARQAQQENSNSLDSCYWDTHNRLNQYAYVMRQKLRIKGIQPQINMFSTVCERQIPTVEIEEEEEEDMELMFEVLR